MEDDKSPIITNHKKRRKTNNIKKEIPSSRIQNIFADESYKNKEVNKSSKSRTMFSVLSGIFIFCLVVVFVFSMIMNIEIPGTESKKIDLDSIKLQDGVKKIADNESEKPLTDVFSPVSENEKQTTDFYVNQKGKNFILSNGYELETKNLTELGKSETINVEPFDGSYGARNIFSQHTLIMD
ncbi:hypothetical protein BG261_08225 [Floricoccus tropicus]|uniref:Uncharacterized protein n=1 Tax=Floricoccus tropicus TaxID=1859473 RepID=A0A1E8GJ14_9LACT|nr:hypothetical protein [Floricoccus tropicus]OFI48260.1 hypothetical protein BG261_08225 [Floricoccus tropicus]